MDAVLQSLQKEYAEDEDAVEMIERAKQDMAYLQSRSGGQTPMQHLQELVGFFETWH